MSRHRKIDVRMYIDARFRKLSAPPPCGRYLWIYLLTNPETVNLPGLYRAGEAGLAEALGWSLKGFREAFREVLFQGMAEADWKARVLWIPRAISYNAPESPNVVRGWRTTWDEIPECELKTKAYSHLKAFVEAMGEGFAKAFAEACPQALPNQEQEPEQEQEQEKDFPPLASLGTPPGGERAPRGTKPKTAMPEGFILTDPMAQEIRKVGCTDPSVAFAQFRDTHAAKSSRFADWLAAWRTWCRNHDRYGCPCQRTRPRAAPPPAAPAYPDFPRSHRA